MSHSAFAEAFHLPLPLSYKTYSNIRYVYMLQVKLFLGQNKFALRINTNMFMEEKKKVL